MSKTLIGQNQSIDTKSEDDIVREALETAALVISSASKQKKRDPNWGLCDEACVDDGCIATLTKTTFVCKRHSRKHTCDKITGDDHPVILVDNIGQYVCLFSNFVIKGMVDMSYQDYDPDDKYSAMKMDDVQARCNVILTERDMYGAQYARENAKGSGEEGTKGWGCKPGRKRCRNVDNSALKRRKTRSSVIAVERIVSRISMCACKNYVPIGCNMEDACMVEEKIRAILWKLCCKEKRVLIVEQHKDAMVKELGKKIAAYKKSCHRSGYKCIVQITEEIALQTIRKHRRCVPSVTASQISEWAITSVLMWHYFSPYRKQARLAERDIANGKRTDSGPGTHAGVMQFAFGCLYVISKGLYFSGSDVFSVSGDKTHGKELNVVLPHDRCLAQVMPPACDLKHLGYKYQYKSMGRKLVLKAISDSSCNGCVDKFKLSYNTFMAMYRSNVAGDR